MPGGLPLRLPTEAATRALGAALSRALAPGFIVALRGDLGSGKTTLVRGLLAALGHRGKVKSPTFSLVESYEVSRLNLYHFDFFRLEVPTSWVDAGFRDCFDGEAVCIIEWPERAAGLPEADVQILLSRPESTDYDEGREATVEANTAAGLRCLQQLEYDLPPTVQRAS